MIIRVRALGALLLFMFMAVSPVAARSGRDGCGCSCGVLVDAAGNLNPEHCKAGRVIDILGRYAERLHDILPEPDDMDEFRTVDLRVVQTELGVLQSEVEEALLELMTIQELESLGLPFLPGPPGEQTDPGEWNGPPVTSCLSATSLIADAAAKLAVFDPSSITLDVRLSESGCPLSYYSSFARDRWTDAFHAIDSAADQMSNGLPGAAAWNSAFAQYSAGAAEFALLVHYYHVVQQDTACLIMLHLAQDLDDATTLAGLGSDRARACDLGF